MNAYDDGMPTVSEQIEQIEMGIKEAQEFVERGRRAQRLHDNPDFKEIVVDGYFLHEAARLANIVSEPNLNDQQRAEVQDALRGLGAFRRYLSHVVRMGEQMETEIANNTDLLEELRLEEQAEDDFTPTSFDELED